MKRKRSEKVENKGKDAKKKKKTRSRRGRKRSSCSGRRRKKRSRSGRSQRKGGDKEKRAAAGIGANSPGRSTSSSSTSSTWAYTPVDQKRMFARSGLDPVRRARNRKRRKAQRYAQRGRRTTGESKSSSSGEGAGLKGQTIFGEHQRVRAVGLNFPGVLSAQAIEDMQELMLTEAGQQTLQQDGWMPTLFAVLPPDAMPQGLRTDGQGSAYTMHGGRLDPSGSSARGDGRVKSLEDVRSPGRRSCMGLSSAARASPKRHGHVIVETGAQDRNIGAESGSPSSSIRRLVDKGQRKRQPQGGERR